MATESVYMATYKWCCSGAGFPLIREARIHSEMIYNVAPQYRMTEEQLDADMTRQGLREMSTEDTDLVVLENVGNLVCPAVRLFRRTA